MSAHASGEASPVEAAAEAIRRVPGATFMNSRQAARAALTAVLPLLPPGTWLSEETQRHVASITKAHREMALEALLGDLVVMQHDNGYRVKAVPHAVILDHLAALRPPDAGVGGGS